MLACSVHDILDVLDDACRQHLFPSLDGHGYPIDVRLHAYCDYVQRWAVVIETVRYVPPGLNIYDVLHVFGNCVWGANGAVDPYRDVIRRVDNWEQVEDPRRPGCALPGWGKVRVRNQELPFSAVPGDNLQGVLRNLVPPYRDLFLGDTRELHQRIPEDLTEILRVDHWHHPDVRNGVLPSQSEAFQQLAQVLSSCDPRMWSPTELSNVHWSNWMVSEILGSPTGIDDALSLNPYPAGQDLGQGGGLGPVRVSLDMYQRYSQSAPAPRMNYATGGRVGIGAIRPIKRVVPSQQY